MLVTNVKEAAERLEAGQGPVYITASLARELAAEHPALFDGKLKRLRAAALGPGPYAPGQYEKYELVIQPDPNPVSGAERRAAEKLGKALAAAREAEVEAAAHYEAAARVFYAATGRALAAGASAEMGISVTWQPLPSQRADRKEFDAARGAEAEARTGWEEAGAALQRARIALAKVERRIEWATRVARS